MTLGVLTTVLAVVSIMLAFLLVRANARIAELEETLRIPVVAAPPAAEAPPPPLVAAVEQQMAPRAVTTPQPELKLFGVRPTVEIPIRVQLKRCFVESIRLYDFSTSHDVNGRVTYYTFRTALKVTNNTKTPTGPRVEVSVWDPGRSVAESENVAYSQYGDLESGESKVFEETMSSDFAPTFVSIREVD